MINENIAEQFIRPRAVWKSFLSFKESNRREAGQAIWNLEKYIVDMEQSL